VVSIPELDGTRCSPVCMSTNEPVPYVFLAIPTVMHAWPNSAGLLVACHAADRGIDAAEGTRVAPRDLAAGVANLGEVCQRHSKQRCHLIAPHPAPDVEE